MSEDDPIKMNVTPEKIDENIIKLVNMISPGSIPIYVPVEPESYAKPRECFPAVKEKISRDGGTQEIGWQIWKTDIITEAEFHAVWKSPEGKLKDITPKQIPVERILFLPDPELKYEDSQVDNVRVNISGNELVDDFIELAKAVFKIENKGERALRYEIRLSAEEAELHHNIKEMQAGIYWMVKKEKNSRNLCFCGSHTKYIYCHGKKLSEYLRRI